VAFSSLRSGIGRILRPVERAAAETAPRVATRVAASSVGTPLLGLPAAGKTMTAEQMSTARRMSSARFQAAQQRLRTPGGMPGPARPHGGGGRVPLAIGSGRASTSPAAAARQGWLRSHPGLAMGGAALGLSAASLMRNQGPGATGNGYMPTGSSSGGGGGGRF
jgi:hypothetical protein